MIQLVLGMYHVPEDIRVMQDDYFSCFRMQFSTNSYTTDWINLEIGIAIGCAISPVLFVMAMEVILKATDDSAGLANLSGGCYKTGSKWKVVEAVDKAKECLKIKKVIGQTQIDCKGLGSSTAKLWSKAEGKEKRDMVTNEIRLNEDSRRVQNAVQQPQWGQWTNLDNALQKSLSWNEIWHMAPLRISFLIKSV